MPAGIDRFDACSTSSLRLGIDRFHLNTQRAITPPRCQPRPTLPKYDSEGSCTAASIPRPRGAPPLLPAEACWGRCRVLWPVCVSIRRVRPCRDRRSQLANHPRPVAAVGADKTPASYTEFEIEEVLPVRTSGVVSKVSGAQGRSRRPLPGISWTT